MFMLWLLHTLDNALAASSFKLGPTAALKTVSRIGHDSARTALENDTPPTANE